MSQEIVVAVSRHEIAFLFNKISTAMYEKILLLLITRIGSKNLSLRLHLPTQYRPREKMKSHTLKVLLI